MITAKQTELIDMLMLQLNEDEKMLCDPVIKALLELGYTPQKHKKSTFVVSFDKKGRTIIKLEIGNGKNKEKHTGLIFWFRYSASNDYSLKFQKPIIELAKIHKSPYPEKCCGLCKGNPQFYKLKNADNSEYNHCGGFTIRFYDMSSEDVPEILKHIKNQDEYFNKLLDVNRI